MRRRPSLWQRTDALQAAVLIRSVQRVTVVLAAERAAGRPLEAARIDAMVAEVVGEYQALGERTGQGVVLALADRLGQAPEQVWGDVVRGLTPDGVTDLAAGER